MEIHTILVSQYTGNNMLVPLQDCISQAKSLKCRENRKRLTYGKKAFSYSFVILYSLS